MKIDLSKTDAKTAIKHLMLETGVSSLGEIAKKIEMKDTTFRSALDNESIRVKDFVKAVNSLGYNVVVTTKTED